MGTIAARKTRAVAQAFTGRCSFWNRSHSRNTTAAKAMMTAGVMVPSGRNPVSYTHLDVYKRQEPVRVCHRLFLLPPQAVFAFVNTPV